jgi:hypothetical protein
MMVPLTQSLYAPGRVGDSGKVLVDIGTGYFVEVSCAALACGVARSPALPLAVARLAARV